MSIAHTNVIKTVNSHYSLQLHFAEIITEQCLTMPRRGSMCWCERQRGVGQLTKTDQSVPGSASLSSQA